MQVADKCQLRLCAPDILLECNQNKDRPKAVLQITKKLKNLNFNSHEKKQ